PYNIATPVLFRLLDLRARFPRAVGTLRGEMAGRRAARAGSAAWGVTSVLVQAFAEVRVAFGVSRRSFLPRPDVDSAVLDIRWSAGPRADLHDVDLFREVVRAAFGQRRKMLRNALAGLAARRGVLPEAALARAAVAPTARAETLDLAAFGRADERHDHVVVGLDDGRVLTFNDARRFGRVAVIERAALSAETGDGIDPLDRGFTADALIALTRGRRTPIKALLMDQRRVAGLGNIYVNELLFRAGIRPGRRASRLGREECARV